MKMTAFSFILLITFLFSAVVSSAQIKQRVRFGAGTSSASVKDSVRAYAYKDYIIKASAGQTIDVKLTSPNTFSVLTIFLPKGGNLDGAAEMDEFTGELPASGDYVIRVLMMRAEARRPRSVSDYTLRISIR